MSALINSQFGDNPSLFVDPECENFGGVIVKFEGNQKNVTCRFRYQPYDNLIEKQTHVRAFGELNSELGTGTTLHLEGLWAEATIPEWRTTPSFPPISLYDGLQAVLPENPGRQALCAANAAAAGFGSAADCLQDDWYFYGRMVGNSGPGRELRRSSRTQRIAASLDRHFESFGGGEGHLDISASYSRASGNVNQPAEYAYRKYLAYRGFGGPDCGVGVVVDPTSAAGMSLGSTGEPSQGRATACSTTRSATRSSAPSSRGRATPTPTTPATWPARPTPPSCWAGSTRKWTSSTRPICSWPRPPFSGSAISDALGYALGYQFPPLRRDGDAQRRGQPGPQPLSGAGGPVLPRSGGAVHVHDGVFPL